MSRHTIPASSGKTRIMGILNITPDSFSENGANFDPGVAVAAGLQMLHDGADILDIGGESSRPGAEPVGAQDEQARVLPVIRELRKQTDAPISIDTYKASTARAALDCGADMINDISGFHRDPEMKRIAAESGACCIAMHMRGTPQTMQQQTDYQRILPELLTYFKETRAMLLEHGVAESAIVFDPGIGFAKTVEQNLYLMKHLDQLQALGQPLLLGTSRKSFIGKTLGLADPQQRIWGTAATVSWAVAKGVQIVRVHDVPQMRQICAMTEAMRDAPE